MAPISSSTPLLTTPRSETTARGSVFIPLTCKSTNDTLEFWGTNYTFRETSCTTPDTAVSVSSLSHNTLPRFALEEPYHEYQGTAYAGLCLLRHLRTTGWDIDLFSMTFNNTSSLGPATSASTIAFFANNRQLHGGYDSNQIPVPLLPGTNHTNGTKWIDCHESPEEANRYPCRFQYDSESRRFTLTRFTKCDDIDHRHP